MLLKVGELAASAQLTVRTLHHYDAIGLLKPSARSEAGYRLYTRADIARLHAILALRQLGFGLADMAKVFADRGADLPAVLAQQIESLHQQMAQGQALLARLELLQTQLATGTAPPLSEWLSTLSRMSTYGRYFSPAELQQILTRQPESATAWAALFKDVQTAMDQGVLPTAPAAQPLAQRWLALMFAWMGGDYELMGRWGQMHRAEPAVYGHQALSPEMVQFISMAIDQRKTALLRHMSLEELQRIRPWSAAQWGELAGAIARLQKRRHPVTSPAARKVLQRWAAQALAQVGHDRSVLAKLMTAIRCEPLLQAAAGDQQVVSDFVVQAMRVHGDPFAREAFGTASA